MGFALVHGMVPCVQETTMELGIIMEMFGMVGVVMVAEVEAVQEVVLLGVEGEVMVSQVDTMTMLKVHLLKAVVGFLSSVLLYLIYI